MAEFPGVGSWIERRARFAPDDLAIAHGETRRTYVDLADRISRLSAGLREMGVVRGARVVWLGERHPACLEALFAVAKLGAVFAPVNHRLDDSVVRDLLKDYGANVAIVEDAAAAIPLPRDIRIVRVGAGAGSGSFEDVIATASGPPPDVHIDEDEVCLMPHTSGTTGPPKGVMLTHANVTWNAINMVSVADLRSDDVTLALAPLFRAGGTGVNVLPLLFTGGTVVIPKNNTLDGVLDAMQRERVTVGFGNPDLLDALTTRPRWATVDLSCVRCIITGGAPVSERLIRTYGARGVTFLQGYGLSEAAPVVSVLDAASAARKVGSAGRPVPFVDVMTARPDGSACAPDEIGELLVRGPNVMAGYWNRADATRAALDEAGWLHTGDAARIDDGGFIWIVDRVADAYTAQGHVVYPGDVERCIGQHPAVRDVGVVGVDGSGYAFVVVRDGMNIGERDLVEHCEHRLDRHAVPSVAFVAELPRTSVGKIDRRALADRVRSEL